MVVSEFTVPTLILPSLMLKVAPLKKFADLVAMRLQAADFGMARNQLSLDHQRQQRGLLEQKRVYLTNLLSMLPHSYLEKSQGGQPDLDGINRYFVTAFCAPLCFCNRLCIPFRPVNITHSEQAQEQQEYRCRRDYHGYR